ncbi:MAG TPA: DUF2721 domain-containing protein [Gemmata sp.]
MEMTLQTPSLLFPAVSLLLLAYTNRFLALATLVRSLEGNYRQSHEGKLLDQIHNLKRRLRLIRNMQLAGVLSLFCCTATMFLLFFGRVGTAEVVFSGGLLLMMASLGISAEEIRVSVRALDLHLTDLGEKRDAGTGS